MRIMVTYFEIDSSNRLVWDTQLDAEEYGTMEAAVAGASEWLTSNEDLSIKVTHIEDGFCTVTGSQRGIRQMVGILERNEDIHHYDTV